MIKTDLNPDDFLKTVTTDFQEDMIKLDAQIASIMQGHPRTCWQGKFWGGSDQTIIGYGDLTYTRPKNNVVEWFLIGLAAQKNYISLYVNASDGKQYLGQKYADTLGKVKIGASSISFKKLADVNLEVLLEVLELAKTTLETPS